MRENGEWRNRVVDRKTGSEWVMRAKEQVLVESNEEGRAKGREYRMPELEAARGMIVGYVLEGPPEIGCVTRVDESGIWVVRGVRSKGRRSARDGLRVVFSGSEENREEIGERWRVLDLDKDKESEETRVRAWVEDARDMETLKYV